MRIEFKVHFNKKQRIRIHRMQRCIEQFVAEIAMPFIGILRIFAAAAMLLLMCCMDSDNLLPVYMGYLAAVSVVVGSVVLESMFRHSRTQAAVIRHGHITADDYRSRRNPL